MQIKAKSADFAWNYAGLFFRMGTNFLLLPFLLSWLTSEALGLWYVFLAISSFITTFQAGFSPSFARNVAYCWSGARHFNKTGKPDHMGEQVDYSVFRAMVAACRKVYRIISITVLFLITTAGTTYVLIVSSNLNPYDYIIAWGVFCISVFLNLYYTYYESLLRGIGDFVGVNKSTIFASVIQLSTSFFMLLSGFGLLSCATAYLLQGISFRVFCRHNLMKHKEIKECLSGNTRVNDALVTEIVKAVYPNAVRDSVVSFANYLMTNANTLLCSWFLGLSESGVFSVTLTILTAVANVSAVVLATYQPALQSAFSNGNRRLEIELSGRVFAGYIGIYAIMYIIAITIIFPFYTLFKKGFSPDWLLVIMMGVYLFLWKQHSTGATLLTNTNQIPYMKSFIISSLLGALLAWALMQFAQMGSHGLILGQAVVQLAYNNWKWPRAAAARLNITFKELVLTGCKSWIQSFHQRLFSVFGGIR